MSYLFQSFCFVSTTHPLWDPTMLPSSTLSRDETPLRSSEQEIPSNQNPVPIPSHLDETPAASTASTKTGQLPARFVRNYGTYYSSPYSDTENIGLRYVTKLPHLGAPAMRTQDDQEIGREQEHTNERSATLYRRQEIIDPREMEQLHCQWRGCDHSPFNEKREILRHISDRHLPDVKFLCRHLNCNKAYRTMERLKEHDEKDH